MKNNKNSELNDSHQLFKTSTLLNDQQTEFFISNFFCSLRDTLRVRSCWPGLGYLISFLVWLNTKRSLRKASKDNGTRARGNKWHDGENVNKRHNAPRKNKEVTRVHKQPHKVRKKLFNGPEKKKATHNHPLISSPSTPVIIPTGAREAKTSEKKIAWVDLRLFISDSLRDFQSNLLVVWRQHKVWSEEEGNACISPCSTYTWQSRVDAARREKILEIFYKPMNFWVMLTFFESIYCVVEHFFFRKNIFSQKSGLLGWNIQIEPLSPSFSHIALQVADCSNTRTRVIESFNRVHWNLIGRWRRVSSSVRRREKSRSGSSRQRLNHLQAINHFVFSSSCELSGLNYW